MKLMPVFGEHTVDQLSLMFKSRQINLEPGFQRKSVWTINDRRRLIQSIAAGYPLPSVFLYQRNHKGKLVYDVIDGKQRLETIFSFIKLGRFKRQRFDAKLDIGDGFEWYDWQRICKHHTDRAADFRSYKIQTVEVTGELNQIIDLFVRLRGNALPQEKNGMRGSTRARSWKEAEHLVSRYHRYLRDQRILSPAQIGRMKGTELFSELLMSLHKGGPINKKTSLDRAIGNEAVNGNTLHRLSGEFKATINQVKKMFPDLDQTRFRNSAEFYTLFLLVWEMEKNEFVFKDKKRNQIAFELLRKLSTGVDQLREQLRKAIPGKPAQRLYQEYLLTVQGDTDSSANRERRGAILHNLLWSIYERKDEKRLFASEQRRILWNTDEKRTCPKCRRPLTWKDLTIDHVKAYARGGKTNLKNAQLMHRRCNASKGAM